MTYYVDCLHGLSENDGLTPEKASKDAASLPVRPGDRVLFSRGRTFQGGLSAVSGTPEAPIYYGAYGEGDAPRFSGAQELTEPWIQAGDKVWLYSGKLSAEPGNMIFDGGVSCGKLCFEKESLSGQGDWFYSKFGCESMEGAELFLYSEKPPQDCYETIECAVKYGWRLCNECNHVVLENLHFYGNSVHAFQTSHARDITLRNCEFSLIGGAVWSLEQQIRFGNAIEFWNGAEDIRVENCRFDNIYDSCVTHQGGTTDFTVRNIRIENNHFFNYGMAAYEVRDVMPQETIFSGNNCDYGNGGFASLFDGETRQSEIYPEPMGHHLFLWRIDNPTPGGSLSVVHNRFSPTPKGAAIYARIADAPAGQMQVEENVFKDEYSLIKYTNK